MLNIPRIPMGPLLPSPSLLGVTNQIMCNHYLIKYVEFLSIIC